MARRYRLALAFLVGVTFAVTARAGSPVRFVQRDVNATDVFVDGKLFATWRTGGVLNHVVLTRPILWPILSPQGTAITRTWPLAKPRRKETTDHPHHRGLWLAYGDVLIEKTGTTVNTWAVYRTEPGAPRSTTRYPPGPKGFVRAVSNTVDDTTGTVHAVLEWLIEDSKEPFLLEDRVMCFSGDGIDRWIDFTIRLTAPRSPLVFKDTKEGFLALRVSPALTEGKKDTAKTAWFPPGHAAYLNAYGAEREKGVWGKRSPWVALRGTLESGEPVTIVFMDHPDNLNHPTTWMARGYGLFAVNPFGLRDFTGGKEVFDFRLPEDGSVTFKYRLLFHFGRSNRNQIDNWYRKYCDQIH